MTSLILENADLNRLFPKCRPRGGPPPAPGATTQSSQQPHDSLCQTEAAAITTTVTAATAATAAVIASTNTSTSASAISDDMIDLERDTSDRYRKRANGRKKSGSLSRRTASVVPGFTVEGQLPHATKPLSSSSSSASGRSEDAPQYGSLPGSDHQGQSQQDDSGPEGSPVYILTSAKGGPSYKLRDSRIIEIAGGREVFSQSRGKVAARKSRFLAASNSINNEDIQTDNKLSVKKNNKSPNSQTIWELRSRCGETRKQRANREVTETVFASEVHSVRRNAAKSILDYDSPKSNRSSRIINYDSILNSNNVEYTVPKSITDLDYGLPKSCVDYQSNHNTPARSMAIVSDGEVVVFDDIDDNWQGLRLDLASSNSNQVTTSLDLETDDSQRGRVAPEPPSSSVGSTPSPTTAYHRNTSDFFKVVTPASDCEADSPSPERNHKVARVIGELPIAQYSGSPRRYGVRENTQLPSLLSSPSMYMTPRPGFPQRVLPTTPNHNEKEDTSAEIVIDKTVIENINTEDQPINSSSPSPKAEEEEEDSLKPSTLPADNISSLVSPGGSTFDYLYEFSETRKVLEEFFKCPAPTKEKENNIESFPFQDLDYELRRQGGSAYVGQRLASGPPTTEEVMVHESPKKQRSDFPQNTGEHENNFLDLSVGTGSSEDLGETEVGLQVGHSRNFTLSPETTDCDSNCGDLDSEVSLMMMDNELMPASGLLGSVGDLGNNSDSLRIYTSMPVLEDGLSSGHASDTDNNNPTVMLMKRQINEIEKEIIQRTRNDMLGTNENDSGKDVSLNVTKDILHTLKTTSPDLFIAKKENSYDTNELQLDGLDPLGTPPPPAPQGRQSVSLELNCGEVEAAIKDIRMALQRTKTLPVKSPSEEPPEPSVSPIWIPSIMDGRRRICMESNSEESDARRIGDEADVEIEECPDEEEADTDLETDRLLGQQRTDDQGFYDDKGWRKPKTRTMLPPMNAKVATPKQTPPKTLSVAPIETLAPSEPIPSTSASISPPPVVSVIQSSSSNECEVATPAQPTSSPQKTPVKNSPSSPQSLKESNNKDKEGKKKSRNKEDLLDDPSVLIEGVLFRARYLGSTQLVCEGQPTKSTRMCQAEEAVSRIKAPDGDTQPSTEVDLFISTEKIMVLNTDLKEIMMDHALRTISYIADIGDLVVLMARRRFVPHEMEEVPKINRTPKMICHVFESEEAQFIAQSIGQAFQVAYMEFLKANGIEDHSFVKEMDYQEVLNSQEIFGDELQMFAKKEMQKEVVVPKAKGEILGVVIVESGWGSMLPTVVIANLAPAGAAARCGQLNIGDQIIAINGVSLVGLPLSTCQTYIKNSKNQTVVKLTVVPCAPVVEVKIKRPDTKYQLGFSVQNGVICSLLRGGIAERGGVRVGHRIIEINNQSVVAVPHEKIVNLLATSVGEILMKTMPTSMFRLLTGQESPVYI
ncbi:serine-rich adhesin for platelets isoform X2 [Cardiocondyla obscurior]|uniref:serine-rich adhesin for platelets isoform X2 n=1 Tax=Cardiocondyla obscurior TaxID=286306 RepID=UPI0039657B7C